MRASPPDIGASEATPQLAGALGLGVNLRCAPCAAGVKVTRAPSQSRQCGEESQALIRHFLCAPRLVRELTRSSSRTSREEDAQIHPERTVEVVLEGEGESLRRR
ncbi:unnamed protein product [Pleuronectes platessa]|uniref:Uncharacterized protein n=1 Tax=Pleuronectes platessa TaxID=8262 RepID=A0A9N7Z3L5_PLEPL|nr:unnamed protein product [Pleuronectes platessa]